MNEKPLLSEEVLSILHRLLDKSDIGRKRLQLKFGSKITPELYNFADQKQVDSVWDEIKELEKCNIITLKLPSSQKQGYEPYHNGSISLNPESEETLRYWLKRTATNSNTLLWHDALNKHSDTFEDGGDSLKKKIITFPKKNFDQIATAFAEIATALQTPLTLRQLSARCFWGDSKFLDSQANESLLLATFPSLSNNIRHRPLLRSIYLPSQAKKILFIENQDSFLELAALAQSSYILIYLGGYSGVALRSRELGQTVFTYLNNCDKASKKHFLDFWFGKKEMPCFFWGDLDYAGISILETLRSVFPNVEAWKTGYQPMLEKLKKGFGHSPEVQNKAGQLKPKATGCNYSDQTLIPALEKYRGFLDQELIAIQKLL